MTAHSHTKSVEAFYRISQDRAQRWPSARRRIYTSATKQPDFQIAILRRLWIEKVSQIVCFADGLAASNIWRQGSQ